MPPRRAHRAKAEDGALLIAHLGKGYAGTGTKFSVWKGHLHLDELPRLQSGIKWLLIDYALPLRVNWKDDRGGLQGHPRPTNQLSAFLRAVDKPPSNPSHELYPKDMRVPVAVY